MFRISGYGNSEGTMFKCAFGGFPPAKANRIGATVKAGFRPARMAMEFGVSQSAVRKLSTT
jgi:hypothetical protein